VDESLEVQDLHRWVSKMNDPDRSVLFPLLRFRLGSVPVEFGSKSVSENFEE
jgi:hypothetical protein